MSRHVMVDIETLGSNPGDVILSIGAVEFSKETTVSFFRRIHLGSSILAGFTINPATVEWWSKQNSHAIEMAFYCPGELMIQSALEDFSDFVDKDTFLWAKGPDFDCVLLKAAYDKLGMKIPWAFRNTRDVRTMLGLSGVKQVKNETAHHALADAILQAKAVLEAHNELGVALE